TMAAEPATSVRIAACATACPGAAVGCSHSLSGSKANFGWPTSLAHRTTVEATLLCNPRTSMTILHSERPAFGKPSPPPRWTSSDKQAVGTAYSASSRVWFTLSAGILNEIYYPTIDQPQTRDLQYLVTDGATFFQDERQLETTLTELSDHSLGFQI